MQHGVPSEGPPTPTHPGKPSLLLGLPALGHHLTSLPAARPEVRRFLGHSPVSCWA